MSIVIFLIGFFLLYVVVQLAIDHSVTNKILRENHKVLVEIRDLLKQDIKNKN